MRINKWTLGLTAVGLVSFGSVAQAQYEESLVPLTTAVSQTVISGYVDVSAVWNPGTGNVNSPPFAFNAGKQDGFNLNVVNLTLEKPLDEGEWSAGYKAELLFGPDATGYNTSVGAAAADYSIKQAYVALRAPVGNGLDLKVGTFDTIIGYESFNSHLNPNYTRSYGYTIEPTQHTGVLASYQFSEIFGASFGVANTVTPGINARSLRGESHKTYMGSVTLTAPESMGALAGSSLYAGVIDGFAGGTDDQTSYYVGATVATPVAGLRLGFAYDNVRDLGGAAHADVIALYASFQATEKLSLHARGEYGQADLNLGFPGVSDSVRGYALTATVQYDLWQNVLSRLEVRWDHIKNAPIKFGGTTGGSPARKEDAFMVAANLVYVF